MATEIKPPQKARLVKTCDVCRKEKSYLNECDVCGGDYCMTCEAIIPASYGFYKVCEDCQDRYDVKQVCEEYADELQPIYQKRREALRSLPSSAEDSEQENP